MAPADPAPRIVWCDGEPLAATCPVCADARPKPALLRVTTLGADRRDLTLVTCATCTLTFFPALSDPIAFSDGTEAAAVAQFELAIGLRGSIDCLERIDVASVRRFLDVGCGTGLTLDWARDVHGWEVLGVDTSVMAAIAPRELGVPVVHGLLGQTGAVAGGAWDLVFACEVIEHVTDPAAFLRAVRTALAPDGTFLMRTPAAEGLDPRRPENAIIASLSPGYHTMIHTAASLERTLRAAGFTDVRVLRDGDTLHAAASTAPLRWTEDARIDPARLLRYLRERVAALPRASAARLGMAQQLVNETVNAGDAADAHDAMRQLDDALVARGGTGVDAPAGDVPLDRLSPYCAAFMARAMLARLDGDVECAEERFAAAATVARAGIEQLRALNALDPGLEVNLRLAEQARFALLAARDPDGAVAQLDALLHEAASGPERAAMTLTLFVDCMAAGALVAASRLADDVLSQLGAASAPPTALARDARWALAMLLLHHERDYDAARRQFAAAGDDADGDERRWAARFHEAYAQWYGGDRAGAAPLLREVIAAASGPDGGPASEWREQARSLLDHSG